MQDKEIDQLFRSGFEDFEVEPPAKVWGQITQKLNTDERKLALLPYLKIAASILLVAGLGWYFVPRNMVKPQKAEQVAATIQPSDHIHQQENTPEKKVTQQVGIAIDAKMIASKKTKTVNRPAIDNPEQSWTPAPVPQPVQNIQRNQELANAVVPGVETALVTKTDATDEPVFTTQQPAPVLQTLKNEKVLAAAPAKKHRISTFGDLINVVVSKVDKRKDKIIEFSTSDEDESTISAVNLGFVKIKKQD